MSSRLLALVAAVLILGSSALADPVSYDLVIDIPGILFGSELSGSFTFPSAFVGLTTIPASSISAFDITVVGYSPAGAGWHLGDIIGGEFSFLEPIGSALLTPAEGAFVFSANPFVPATPFGLYLWVFQGTSLWQWFGYDDKSVFFADGASTTVPAVAWHLKLAPASPVPESGTLLLFSLGGALLAWRGRWTGSRLRDREL